MKCKNIILIFSIFFVFFLNGCAPKRFEPWKPPEIKYEKTEEYDISKELNKIKKPEKIEPFWCIKNDDDNIKFVQTPDIATHVLLVNSEYRKVAVLVKLAGTYKKIIYAQENLINMYIDEINVLKSQVTLERQMTIKYRGLWIETENLRRDQIHELKRESFYKNIIIMLEGIGMVGILILSL